MTRSERSRLVMKMSWQIFRTSDATHSEAMKMAHQMVDRKLNPDRASRRIKAHVRESFENIPEHVTKITSGPRMPVYVPVDISKLPTGPMKNSSVYKRGWTTGLTSSGGVGHLHGVGKRPKRSPRSSTNYGPNVPDKFPGMKNVLHPNRYVAFSSSIFWTYDLSSGISVKISVGCSSSLTFESV